MNMKQWLRDQMELKKRRALPVLSFPCTQLMGITVRELVTSSENQAQGMAAVARRCPTAAAVSMMDLSVEAECFGAQIRFTDDEVPTVVGAVVSDPDQAEALQVPAVGADRTGIYVEAIGKTKELITDRPVLAGVIGPFSLAGRLMDMTEIMINCYEEPEMVHTVLDKAAQFITDYIRAYKEVGADGVVMAEPAAGLLSPSICEEFSTPYVRRIIDAVQTDDFIVVYHNCGNSVSLMPDQVVATGAAAYHFGNAIDLAEMLGKLPDDQLVMGNVDPVGAFFNGTPESVRADTRKVLEACSDHRNFLISSGCDIPPRSPWENIDAFFAAVEEFYQ